MAKLYELTKAKKEKAMAHARAIARRKQYNGCVEVYFNPATNEFVYFEIVGYDTTETSDEYIYVGSENVSTCY